MFLNTIYMSFYAENIVEFYDIHKLKDIFEKNNYFQKIPPTIDDFLRQFPDKNPSDNISESKEDLIRKAVRQLFDREQTESDQISEQESNRNSEKKSLQNSEKVSESAQLDLFDKIFSGINS